MKASFIRSLFVMFFSFAICSLQAQTLKQKVQKDIGLRQKNANEVLINSKQQREQQKAERLFEIKQEDHPEIIRENPRQPAREPRAPLTPGTTVTNGQKKFVRPSKVSTPSDRQ